MLERMQRLEDVDGIPRVKPSTPNEFFSAIEKDAGNLCTWEGELYLELHQGTFTTQAEVRFTPLYCEWTKPLLVRGHCTLDSCIWLDRGVQSYLPQA